MGEPARLPDGVVESHLTPCFPQSFRSRIFPARTLQHRPVDTISLLFADRIIHAEPCEVQRRECRAVTGRPRRNHCSLHLLCSLRRRPDGSIRSRIRFHDRHIGETGAAVCTDVSHNGCDRAGTRVSQETSAESLSCPFRFGHPVSACAAIRLANSGIRRQRSRGGSPHHRPCPEHYVFAPLRLL